MRRSHQIRLFVVLLVLSLLWVGCGAMQTESSESAATADRAELAEVEASQEPGGAGLLEARRIIATADMDLVVSDTERAVGQIEAILDEVGGFIANSSLYRSDFGDVELLRGSLTLRVPAEQLDATMTALAELAIEVESSNLRREDVTAQYSDIDAQLRNLQVTEQELLALLEEVRERPEATPEDLLAVYRSLTEIRGEIEVLQGRKNVLDNQIALSTIEVTLIPDAANRPLVQDGWRPRVVVRDAVRALVATVQFLANALIWILIYLVPLALIALIPIGILIWLLRWLIRRLQRRRHAGEPSGTQTLS